MKNTSKWQKLMLPTFAALIGAACASTTPPELINARTAYQRASTGPAAQYTPADLHKAKTALELAERNFSDEEDSQKTKDLAYVAERTAQIAEARADAAIAEKKAATAKGALNAKEDAMAKETQGALANTRAQLTEAERAKADQVALTGTERAAREKSDQAALASEQKAGAAEAKTAEAEQKLKESNEALAKLAAKEEARGMVITLSGSVLFRSNDAVLLPAAQSRLDQVADALMAKGKDVVIEGHTDSRGSSSTNMSLSQRRAESVRSYLVSRGFPGEKIQARGIGSDRPIAENTNAEGRANNRRVEIVIPNTAGAVK